MIRLAKTPEGVISAPTIAAAPVAAQAPAPVAAADTPADAEAAGAGDRTLVDVTSPMVGTFYRSPAPDAPPYADVGSTMARGDTLCIIEAMKLMNELEAEVAGKIVEVCVENAQPVEYGQVLFRIDPS